MYILFDKTTIRLLSLQNILLFLKPTRVRAENDIPNVWPRAFTNTSVVIVMLTLRAKEEVQSELELWDSLEASWEARTKWRAAKQRLDKGRKRQPRQELNAPQYRLQVCQSPFKLKARWGLGFTGHIWHQTAMRTSPRSQGCSEGTLIQPTSESRQGPYYQGQQKEDPLCAIGTVLYILNSATFSTQVHFN